MSKLKHLHGLIQEITKQAEEQNKLNPIQTIKPLTSKERARLYRMRKRGQITAETPYDIQMKMLQDYQRQKPASKGHMPQWIRARIKRKTGLTPTQLMQFSEEKRNSIMAECLKDKRKALAAERLTKGN